MANASSAMSRMFQSAVRPVSQRTIIMPSQLHPVGVRTMASCCTTSSSSCYYSTNSPVTTGVLPKTPSSFLTTTTTRYMSTNLRAYPTFQKKPPSANPCGGEMLLRFSEENPHKDVLRFEWKNQKFTLGRLENNAMALATGLVELGFQPGDTFLSWLPRHFGEHVLYQFACSKAGMIMYWLDPAMAITDPVKARKALHNALHLSKANVFLTQDKADDVDYVGLVERVIPEVRIFCFAQGAPFVTPRFPHLRINIQTGWSSDDREGFYLYRDMLVPAEGLLDSIMFPHTISADTPLMGRFVYDDEGIPIGTETPLTNRQVLENSEWPIYASVLRKEYLEVEGKGVVF